MQQKVAQLAGGPTAQNAGTVLQNEENKSAGPSTEVPKMGNNTPKAGAAESSGSQGQDKFYESMTSFIEVMKEKESAGSVLKWDRKAPVIKAESPKGLMTELIDLERLFSELGYKTHRKRWGVFRNALQGKGKESSNMS